MTSQTSSGTSSSSSDSSDDSVINRFDKKAGSSVSGETLASVKTSGAKTLEQPKNSGSKKASDSDSDVELLKRILTDSEPVQTPSESRKNDASSSEQTITDQRRTDQASELQITREHQRPRTAKRRESSRHHRVVSTEKEETSPLANRERPKSAKFGRARRAAEADQASSTVSDDQSLSSRDFSVDQSKEKASSATTSSLVSSASSCSSASSTKSSNAALRERQALLEYRASYLRELLLHRYLDHYHAESLNRHGSYFKTNSRQPTISLSLPPSGRYTTSTNKRGHYERARTIYGTTPTGRRKSTKGQSAREVEIQKAIRRLAEQLLKLKTREIVKDDKVEEMRPKSSRGSRSKAVRKEVQSIETHTLDETSARSKDGSIPSTKRVTLVTPREEEKRSNKSQLDEQESAKTRKGALKHSQRRMSLDKPGMQALPMSASRRRRKNDSAIAPGVYANDFDQGRNSDLDYYLVPNLPGELFSYSYLAALLSTLRLDPNQMLPGRESTSRMMLRPAPVRPKTAARRSRTYSAVSARRSRKVKPPAEADAEETNQNEKKNIDKQRPEDKEAEYAESRTQALRPKSAPQVRPGSEPIKCNWTPNKSENEEKVPKTSDHQLKHTNNPTIADWLLQKNKQAQKKRLYNSRRNRLKREQLMQEHNDREDKREQALVEYEKWKKRKNREILLRRRREIAESNASEKAQENVIRSGTDTAPSAVQGRKDSNITTFSDLRSSSTTASSPEISKPTAKRRPKSAPTKVTFGSVETSPAEKRSSTESYVPVRIDFQSGDVRLLSPKERSLDANLSAREPLIGNIGPSDGKKTDSFLENFLEVTSPKSIFTVPPAAFRTEAEGANKEEPHVASKDVEGRSLSRDNYNKWIRKSHNNADTPTPKKQLARSRSNKKKSSRRNEPSIPEHDPMADSLIPDLAKRRIQKILDQKREVDTGLGRNRPRSAVPSKSSDRVPEEIKRWRLREDLTVEGNDSKKAIGKQNSKKLAASKFSGDNDRPVFSYDKKSESKSVFFERNPVVRRAINASLQN